jgi:hypothetical protein
MSGRHIATLAESLTMPSGLALPIAAAPRHSTATHHHDFKIVAVFNGLRESITQCGCGQTKTTFHTETDA